MKVVILAGGLGTRLSEETVIKPKPMVEIGSKPILWHIMKSYAHFGFSDFVVALGYKGDVIKDYFLNYYNRNSDFTIDLGSGGVTVHSSQREDWKITLVDTGLHTQTGGRLKRLQPYIEGDTFMMTYGDGVADVDIRALVAYHRAHGRLATVTAVRPLARFGTLMLDGNTVTSFAEKPEGSDGMINGGFFVLEPGVLKYVDSDSTIWEREPMEGLARDRELVAYNHYGYWQCMDTLRDVKNLNDRWEANNAPWKVWAVRNEKLLVR